jgi:hypothetical protein
MARDPAAQRLKKLIIDGRHISEITEKILEQAALPPPPSVARSILADYATTLSEQTQLRVDKAIRKAFEVASLDPSDPFAWRRLLGYCALALFPQGKRGRKRKNLKERAALYADLINQRYPNWSGKDDEIAALLKNYLPDFAGIQVATIREYITKGRSERRRTRGGKISTP